MLSEEKPKVESEKEKTKGQNVQKLLENIANNIKNAYQAQENEYFNLQLTIQDNVKYSNSVTKNLMRLPIEAQIEILRTLAKTAEVSKEICERYDIDMEEE